LTQKQQTLSPARLAGIFLPAAIFSMSGEIPSYLNFYPESHLRSLPLAGAISCHVKERSPSYPNLPKNLGSAVHLRDIRSPFPSGIQFPENMPRVFNGQALNLPR
jgi:hypothetical protein